MCPFQASPTGDKSGGVPGVSEDAGMGESEPRQGADLKTQIGLFVEMSTPFFKVSTLLVTPKSVRCVQRFTTS